MEKAILERLEWKLTVPTPYVFLVRFTRTFALSPDQQVIVIYLNSNTKNYQIQLTCFACHLIHIVQMKNMAFFLAELGRVHYGTANLFLPSMTAAAAVYAAQCTLNRKPLWNDEILKNMAGYTAPQIRDCAKLPMKLHPSVPESQVIAVHRKFCTVCRVQRRCCFSIITEGYIKLENYLVFQHKLSCADPYGNIPDEIR
ncbi:hypothetical protein GLYMA_13G342100v4 [Glycine max]|uniref:Uncharacterized protein n=1 Tax=Glycine max TaxID=3847 RepID=A0A0R0HAJ2_SOYBN|nr:hypothetical protein GLYMA_13G342100v4 [Glycine max]